MAELSWGCVTEKGGCFAEKGGALQKRGGSPQKGDTLASHDYGFLWKSGAFCKNLWPPDASRAGVVFFEIDSYNLSSFSEH